jgi:hypothetical protein
MHRLCMCVSAPVCTTHNHMCACSLKERCSVRCSHRWRCCVHCGAARSMQLYDYDCTKRKAHTTHYSELAMYCVHACEQWHALKSDVRQQLQLQQQLLYCALRRNAQQTVMHTTSRAKHTKVTLSRELKYVPKLHPCCS